MKLRCIDSVDVKGKRVLLRLDINSPVEKKKVVMNERIEEAVESINFLKKRKAKVIILAHQGRPNSEDFISLKQHAELLSKKTKVRFIDDVFGEKAEKEILRLKEGEALLLENIRFFKEEYDNSENNPLIKKLSSLIDFFVNDAFSVSHREQASITGFPKIMKERCFIGILMKKELNALEKLKIKKALFILGGSKAEENLLFFKKNRKILVAGLFGQLCLKAKGVNFGAQEKYLELEKLNEVKKVINKPTIVFPKDFAVIENNKRKEISLKDFPNDKEIYDIGEETIKSFEEEILKAKTIFMKGPCGYITDKRFLKGTERILKAIIRSKAYSVLGGGHLTTALKILKIPKKSFSHISLSGGALATYLAGKKLIGLEVLK
ncbi:MAG: phosphoglycerate kinase [Candidatus Pacearchaeota archaeon]